jgi:hypothetical protein
MNNINNTVCFPKESIHIYINPFFTRVTIRAELHRRTQAHSKLKPATWTPNGPAQTHSRKLDNITKHIYQCKNALTPPHAYLTHAHASPQNIIYQVFHEYTNTQIHKAYICTSNTKQIHKSKYNKSNT